MVKNREQGLWLKKQFDKGLLIPRPNSVPGDPSGDPSCKVPNVLPMPSCPDLADDPADVKGLHKHVAGARPHRPSKNDIPHLPVDLVRFSTLTMRERMVLIGDA
jgi:hypothetical protein